MNSYEQWLAYIKENKDPNYWEHIVHFAPQIAEDLHNYKQHIVQKKLCIKDGPTLSHIKPLIKAIANDINND